MKCLLTFRLQIGSISAFLTLNFRVWTHLDILASQSKKIKAKETYSLSIFVPWEILALASSIRVVAIVAEKPHILKSKPTIFK